jgi:FkbM family methyltransferase
MKISERLQRAANAALYPLGYQLRPLPKNSTPMTMGGAIRRAKERGWQIGSVIDVGAADGDWSRFTMRYFPDAKYLLIDALEERRTALEKLRSERPNVEFVLAAAGAELGEVEFGVARDLDSSGIFDGSGATRRVRVTTIDAEVAKRNLPPPYLLKLDTHGYELPILTGAKRTLQQTSLLILEAYNFQLTQQSLRFHEMIAHVEELGFRCCELVDPLLRPGDQLLWQIDLLFIPKTSPHFARESYAG